MKAFINALTAFCSSAVAAPILFELSDFIYTSAMTEHEVATLSRAIFIPLFVVGLVISALLTGKKKNTRLRDIGLLVMGAMIILLAFLNVYNLQMLLPLVKTNSITTVVMWIARIMGGIIGLFCGFAFGSVLSKGIWQYVAFVLGGAVIFVFGISAPDKIPYELLFYSTGALSFITQIINIYFSQKGDRKDVF